MHVSLVFFVVGIRGLNNVNIPLVGNALKVRLVLWVGLHAQADCEDELANSCREAGEESVERLYCDIIVSKTIIPSNLQVQLLMNQFSPPYIPLPTTGTRVTLTKLPAITQYANCSTPTAIKKTRKASSSFTRCGVSSTYLFQMPTPISCKSCALRTWPLVLEAGLLAERVGWPAEEGTTVVALVALGGMAAGEGVVGTFLGAILVVLWDVWLWLWL